MWFYSQAPLAAGLGLLGTQRLYVMDFQKSQRSEEYRERNLCCYSAFTYHLLKLTQLDIRSDQMNWDRVEGNWTEFKGKVQQKWGKLTSDDLEIVKGKRNELSGRLQQRYGYAKDQAEREIDTWLRNTV
jgi:uncharacterized protein YjbJ (UPF0337 family)